MCLIIGGINHRFFLFQNITDILRTTSYVLIIASAATFVFIMAGLDLSVGSVVGLSGMIVGLLMTTGVPILISILLAVIMSALIGLFNGIAIVKWKIPAMIVTLGTLYICRGIANVLTEGKPVFPLPEAFNEIGGGKLFLVPYSVYIMILLAIVFGFVLKHTTFGRCVYAIGGNEETARLSGINVDLVKIAVYVLCSSCAGLSGIIVASRLGSSQVAAGTGWELKVIASVIIGGTSTFGGAGTMTGTVIGACIMSVIDNGLVLARVNTFWQNVLVGIIIVATVGFDQFRRNAKKEL
jgi:ribose/xylose/arabinose/galactoside ABC-type transport system permease subunit